MKRKHTKLICLGLALCLLTGLALGCNSSTNKTETATSEDAAQTTDQTTETTWGNRPHGLTATRPGAWDSPPNGLTAPRPEVWDSPLNGPTAPRLGACPVALAAWASLPQGDPAAAPAAAARI